MKKIVLIISLLLCSIILVSGFTSVNSINHGNYATNVGRNDGGLIAGYLQRIATPELADADQVTNDAVIAIGGTTVVLGLTNPDVARNLVIDIDEASSQNVKAGTVTINGTNVNGQTIQETFTLIVNDSAPITGSKAFKTVTSIVFPAQDGGLAAVDIGTGSKLGLERCVYDPLMYIQGSFGGTIEATRATVAASATAVESNTVQLNTTLNGSTVYLLYLYVVKDNL